MFKKICDWVRSFWFWNWIFRRKVKVNFDKISIPNVRAKAPPLDLNMLCATQPMMNGADVLHHYNDYAYAPKIVKPEKPTEPPKGKILKVYC